jgi:hypothetical protein
MSNSNLKLRERLLALLDEGKPSPVKASVVVREQSLGTLKGDEPSSPAVVQLAVVEEASATAPDTCPRCGDVMRHIGGPGKRCQACGHQPKVNQATGISRADVPNYEGGQADFHPKGFAMALARIADFGRR